MNPYETLGLGDGAGKDEAAAAFRRLAKSCHPDLHPGDAGAAERFMRIREAHDAIRDGRAASRPRETEARTASPRPKRRDVRREISVTLDEAFLGGVVTVSGGGGPCASCGGDGHVVGEHEWTCRTCDGSGISHSADRGIVRVRLKCPDCGGAGRTRKMRCEDCGGLGVSSSEPAELEIPAGCEDGQSFVLKGAAGDAASGFFGDLEVVVRVRPHPDLRRSGRDVEATVRVTPWDAALGCKAHVPAPGGASFRLSVPPGSQHGAKFRLGGKGMPSPSGPGDLVAVLQIVVPDASSGPLRDALERVRDVAGGAHAPSPSLDRRV